MKNNLIVNKDHYFIAKEKYIQNKQHGVEPSMCLIAEAGRAHTGKLCEYYYEDHIIVEGSDPIQLDDYELNRVYTLADMFDSVMYRDGSFQEEELLNKLPISITYFDSKIEPVKETKELVNANH